MNDGRSPVVEKYITIASLVVIAGHRKPFKLNDDDVNDDDDDDDDGFKFLHYK